MRAYGTVVGLGLAACLAACLGYGSPIEESEEGAQLPERSTFDDSGAGVDDPQPTTPSPTDAGTVDAPVVDATKKPLRAFVSSETKSGNLGGVAAADALCTSLATAAGLGGTYRAWLSVSGADAVDRITSAGPWQLVTGEMVAPDKAGLTNGKLSRLVNRDEKGGTPSDAEDRVWTGTGPNGRYTGPDCAQWAGGGSGLVGEAKNGDDGAWTSLENESCGEVNRVYCFEL